MSALPSSARLACVLVCALSLLACGDELPPQAPRTQRLEHDETAPPPPRGADRCLFARLERLRSDHASALLWLLRGPKALSLVRATELAHFEQDGTDSVPGPAIEWLRFPVGGDEALKRLSHFDWDRAPTSPASLRYLATRHSPSWLKLEVGSWAERSAGVEVRCEGARANDELVFARFESRARRYGRRPARLLSVLGIMQDDRLLVTHEYESPEDPRLRATPDERLHAQTEAALRVNALHRGTARVQDRVRVTHLIEWPAMLAQASRSVDDRRRPAAPPRLHLDEPAEVALALTDWKRFGADPLRRQEALTKIVEIASTGLQRGDSRTEALYDALMELDRPEDAAALTTQLLRDPAMSSWLPRHRAAIAKFDRRRYLALLSEHQLVPADRIARAARDIHAAAELGVEVAFAERIWRLFAAFDRSPRLVPTSGNVPMALIDELARAASGNNGSILGLLAQCETLPASPPDRTLPMRTASGDRALAIVGDLDGLRARSLGLAGRCQLDVFIGQGRPSRVAFAGGISGDDFHISKVGIGRAQPNRNIDMPGYVTISDRRRSLSVSRALPRACRGMNTLLEGEQAEIESESATTLERHVRVCSPVGRKHRCEGEPADIVPAYRALLAP